MFTIDDFNEVMVDDYYQNKNKTMENSKWEFITSTRFWALVIGAVMFYLKAKGYVGEPEMILANTILGGFITIKTIDRASEQKVLAAAKSGAVTTVTMPSTVSSVSAKTESKETTGTNY